VLVTTDLIGLTAEISEPIRERIAKQLGIPLTPAALFHPPDRFPWAAADLR